MREEAYAALRRYEVMAERLSSIPQKVEEQGERDRENFGDRYLWYGADGGFVWNDLMVIRFLVEVCGIPLKESREAAIENSRVKGVRMSDGVWSPALDQAKVLFREFGNILEAREMAAFYRDVFADDAKAARYWRDVLHEIETTRFVAEAAGLENWD